MLSLSDAGFDPGVGGWLALAVTAAVCLFFLHALWNLVSIPKLRTRPNGPQTAPDCMVVIPARNEELTIARAIASLPHDSVIVVDDSSKDRTAEVASKAGAGVLTAPELTAGALGKSNACLAGARLLQSRWILFADADTWFEAGFLDAAIAAAAAQDLVFLSIHLWPSGRTFWERAIAPLAAALIYGGMRPRSDPTGAFLGQCILVRRDAYEFLGGHAAVLSTFAEDVKLAIIARRHRLNFGVARAGSLGHAQFREPSESLHRLGYRLILLERSALILTIAGATALALWPAAVLFIALNDAYAPAVALLFAPILIAILWYRSAFALLLPLAAYQAAARLWSGLILALTGRRLRWKGRLI